MATIKELLNQQVMINKTIASGVKPPEVMAETVIPEAIPEPEPEPENNLLIKRNKKARK